MRVKARSLGYLFLAGAALGALTLALPHSELVMDRELVGLIVVASLMALALYLGADRLRAWQLHTALGLGTIMLTLATHFVDSTLLYPLLYTWTALFAFYFFTLRVALAHVALIAVCYAVVLAVDQPAGRLVRWLLAVATPLVAGLLISRLLGALRAIAARSDARMRALQESEARMRLVLDSAPDAFVSVDRDGLITSWNSAAERLFGWSASEAVGVSMRSLLIPPEFGDRHEDRRTALVEAAEAVASRAFDVEFVRRDGGRFPGEATVSKIEIEGEVFVAGFIRDVTERQNRQQEREALMREQAARAEAERVTELVSGMQRLVDAALFNRTLDEILADLITSVQGVLSADAAAILLAEQDERLRESLGSGDLHGYAPPADHDGGAAGTTAFGEAFAGRVARAREAMLVQHPAPEELPEPLRDRDIESVIGVPLLAEGEVTGVLVVGAAEPRRFTPEDLALLRLAADRVALAISHARVYEREHRIAETLQRSLLPDRLPQPPGLEVAARYLPAAAEAEVGGDWYDMIATPTGAVGLAMGDVAGKGLQAASMVGRLRSALRAYVLEGHEPSRVVEQLNRLAWAEGADTQMTTFIYAVVDPSEGRMTWVNAGHPAPLLLSEQRVPRLLEEGGSVPLGVLPFPTYEQVSAPMEPGSAVLLYTDGLIERPGEHLDDGLDALATAVRQAPAGSEALCDHLLDTLVPARGALDDVALLTLRNLPVSERVAVEFPAEPESLAQMRSLVRRWLRHSGGGEEDIYAVMTACGEAATNAIEHAGAAGGAPFELSGYAHDGQVEITVRDRGRWRPPREGDHGRGLELMEALMDTVEVTPSKEGTTVRMLRRFTLDGGG